MSIFSIPCCPVVVVTLTARLIGVGVIALALTFVSISKIVLAIINKFFRFFSSWVKLTSASVTQNDATFEGSWILSTLSVYNLYLHVSDLLSDELADY